MAAPKRKQKHAAQSNSPRPLFWLAVTEARACRARNPEWSWAKIASECCPCGGSQHTDACVRHLSDGVRRLELGHKIKSLGQPRRGRRADFPPHVLAAVHRARTGNPKTPYARLVERYCPCLMQHPPRNTHTPECRAALTRAYRRFKAQLRRLAAAGSLLFRAGPKRTV